MKEGAQSPLEAHPRLLVFGSGGHAQVVADAARQAGFTVVGFAHDSDDQRCIIAPGPNWLWPDISALAEDLREMGLATIVAIGDNRTRARRFLALLERRVSMATVVHPRAAIAPGVRLGAGTVVMAGAVINVGTIVGADVIVNTGASIDHDNTIGDHVHICPGVHTGGQVSVGEGAMVGMGGLVRNNASVGDHAILGMGAVLLRDLPPNMQAYGVPARVAKSTNSGLYGHFCDDRTSRLLIDWLTPNDSRWQNLLDGIPHQFYQLPGYVVLEADRAKGEAVALVAEEGAKRIVLPLILRHLPKVLRALHPDVRDAISPYGYSGFAMTDAALSDQAWTQEAVTGMLQRLDMGNVCSVFVRMQCALPQPIEALSKLGATVLHGETVWVDLEKDQQTIRGELRQNHRRVRKKLEAAGFECIVDGNWDRLDDFIRIYYETMEHVHAEKSYFFGREYFEGLRRVLGQRASLYCVLHDNEMIAGGIFCESNGTVQYHLGGTAAKARHQSPAVLMFCKVIEECQAGGYRILHLGGGVKAQNDSLLHFKAGFSTLRKQFFSWRSLPQPGVYRNVMESWFREKKTVGWNRGLFFPPYRAEGGDEKTPRPMLICE